MLLRKGDRLDNRYEILSYVDAGMNAEVYQVLDLVENTPKAAKVSTNELMLAWEFEAAKEIDHQNVVKYLDQGKGVVDTIEVYYVIMEWLPDGNLRRKLKEFRTKGKFLPLDVLLAYMKGLTSGLSAISKRLIHRDLKPENALFEKDTLKVSDFGLSKYVEQATRSPTYKGEGTYPYMAPETWELGHQSVSTDIYSLGIMFYELCTLELPFQASNWLEWRLKHLYELAPDPRKKNPALNSLLANIMRRMMEKEPSKRYQSADQVSEALEQVPLTDRDEAADVIPIVEKARQKYEEESEKKLRLRAEADKQKALLNKARYGYIQLIDSLDNLVKNINERLQVEPITRKRTNGLSPKREIEATRESVRRGERVIAERDENYVCTYYNRQLVLGFFAPATCQRHVFSHRSIADKGLIGASYLYIVQQNDIREGVNFLLMLEAGKMYGEWKTCETRDHALSATQHKYQPFAITEVTTLLEDLALHWAGVMHIHALFIKDFSQSDLLTFLDKLVSPT